MHFIRHLSVFDTQLVVSFSYQIHFRQPTPHPIPSILGLIRMAYFRLVFSGNDGALPDRFSVF
jgi:hypothetical protein